MLAKSSLRFYFFYTNSQTKGGLGNKNKNLQEGLIIISFFLIKKKTKLRDYNNNNNNKKFLLILKLR